MGRTLKTPCNPHSAEHQLGRYHHVFSSDKTSPTPISCDFFRLTPGEPLVYTYKYDEMKIFLEGDYTITDATGQTAEAKGGDVVFFPKGSTITFTTKAGGMAFYVDQRKMSDF